MNPWVSILMHLAERPGAITGEKIRQELFPAMPLYACRNLIDELKSKGFLAENEDGAVQLTESGQQQARTGGAFSED